MPRGKTDSIPEEIKLSEKYNNSWEITFTTYDLDYSFSFIWKNNTIQYLILDH